nr:MAG TPA: hypothetical protein [Caudoviricetes sp.]
MFITPHKPPHQTAPHSPDSTQKSHPIALNQLRSANLILSLFLRPTAHTSFRYNPQTLPTFLVTFYKKFTLKKLRHIAQNAKNPLQYPKMLDKSSKKAYN